MFSKVLPTIVLPGTKLFRVKILQSSCAFLVIDVLGSVWCVPGPSKRNARTHSQRNEAKRDERKEAYCYYAAAAGCRFRSAQ